MNQQQKLREAGYQARLAGQPCEAPTTREGDRAEWEMGWRAANNQMHADALRKCTGSVSVTVRENDRVVAVSPSPADVLAALTDQEQGFLLEGLQAFAGGSSRTRSKPFTPIPASPLLVSATSASRRYARSRNVWRSRSTGQRRRKRRSQPSSRT